MTLRERHRALSEELAGIKADMEFDACYGSVVNRQSPFLTRDEVAKLFGISVSKFDTDRKSGEIQLRPIPNSGRKVLFHIEQVEAEAERWKKRRRRS